MKSLQALADASDTISLNDVIGGSIMATQDWGALRYVAALTTGTGYIAKGFLGGFPGFPAWFGKNSKRGKCNRLLNEMSMNLKGSISGSPAAVRQVRPSVRPSVGVRVHWCTGECQAKTMGFCCRRRIHVSLRVVWPTSLSMA